MKKFKPLLIALFITSITNSQSEFKILNSDNQSPIPNVTIYNTSNQAGIFSGNDGTFIIPNSWKSTDSIKFSSIGYTEVKTIIEEILDLKNRVIYMQPKTEILSDVNLKSEKLKNTLNHEQLNDLPVGVYGFSSALINDKIYITGGIETEYVNETKKILDNSVDDRAFIKAMFSGTTSKWEQYNSKILEYNSKENIWKIIPEDITPRAYHNSEVIDDKLYIFGGKTLSKNQKKEFLTNKIEIYDPTDQSVLVDETNPHQSVNSISFTLDSLLIVAGGSTRKYNSTGKKIYSNEIHVFNTNSGFWNKVWKMPEAKESNGLLLNNIFYFVGGTQNKPLKWIETLNLKNGKWERLGQLKEPIAKTSLTVYNDDIYIYKKNRILVFNVDNLRISEYSTSLEEEESEIQIINDALYIIGGALKKKDYEIIPSKSLYKIPLEEFKNTRPVISYQI